MSRSSEVFMRDQVRGRVRSIMAEGASRGRAVEERLVVVVALVTVASLVLTFQV